MNKGKKIADAILCILLLEGALYPLASVMEAEKTAEDEWQARIGAMHVQQVERSERETGREVAPMMDMEDIWAIEDAREEATEPLIDEMHNGSDALGFDRAGSTFYCSIGSGLESWPELALTIRGQEDVQAVWVDDYAYDYCHDAVREGYRYELLAYTDTEYAYTGIVFTGLPIVTLHMDDVSQLGDEYMPARASVSGGGYEAIDSAALVHLRGGRFEKEIDKLSYRVEFHRLSDKGKDKKNDVSVLGMEADSDWLLVSNAGDASCVRNALGFDMWRRWNEDGSAFALLESRMVEVFVQDEYMGLYQMMPRIQADKELERMGGNLNTDASARMIGMRYDTGRPVSEISLPIDGCLELRQYPETMDEEAAFALYEDYVRLNLPDTHEDYLSDEAFAQLALSAVDVRDIMSYYLYMNICSLPYDNVKNNVYIWARKHEDGYTYTLSPWDMDSGFSPLFMDGTESINLWMTLPVRMLHLDVGGCREVLWEIYREKRETLISNDEIYQWIYEMEEKINASGAYLRETERWRGGAQPLSLAEISAYTISQIDVLERYMREVWPE